MDRGLCSQYPDNCESCDQENSSFHLLFQCKKFGNLRSEIFMPVGIREFNFSCFLSESRLVHRALVLFGRRLYYAVRDSIPAAPSPTPSA